MSMQIEGSSNEQNPNRYTMESLNIQQGTYKASIFQKIDASDGSVDGFLTEEQYQRYSEIDTPFKAFVKLIKSPFENIKKGKEAKEKAQISPEAEQAFENLGSEWHTPIKGSYTQGTVMRTVRNDDGSYYEEYKNPDTGRTYISYDASGNRTGGSWNTIINGTEYPTRKEWTDSEGNYRAINIVYDEQGNVLKEYDDDEDYEPIQREIKK